MSPEELKRELEVGGLRMLGVSQHHSNPEVLVVYLHGNAGQSADGFAKHLIAGVPGVVAVEESVSAATILLALVPLTGGG